MMIWKPCISFRLEPMIVPIAEKTSAMSAMTRIAVGTTSACRGTKAGEQTDAEDEQSLKQRDRRAADGSSHHDRQPRHGRDERLLEEAELPVPEQRHAGERRREEDRHAHDAGRHELEVAPFAGALKDRTEAEAEHAEVHHGRAERADHLCGRAEVFPHLAHPECEDDSHRRLHMRAASRMRSVAPGTSSRMSIPVSARYAPSSDSLFVRCFSSAGDPIATMRP